MLWNFIKVSIRNIRRHKLFSAINMVSLTLSLIFCLAALMIIKNQLEFDTFHPHPERTYRIITELSYENNSIRRFANTPLPLGDRLEREYPFVEDVTRFYRISGRADANGRLLQIRGSFAESSFFSTFGFGLKTGNPSTALADPQSIVLTRETARRFFGDQNPVGEEFRLQNVGTFTVTGVLDRDLSQTHLQFDFLASFRTLALSGPSLRNALDSWLVQYTPGYTYLKLKPGTPRKALEGVLPALSKRISESHELEDHVTGYRFEVQSLGAISPGEALTNEFGGGKIYDTTSLISMAAIALVILLMACFNYTNLSIARALKRTREVGIYKVLGARRRQIVSQLVIQSTLMAGASLAAAYALLPWAPLPPRLLQEVRSITPDIELIAWFAGFAIFTGLLAGLVPAIMISSRSPINLLKNRKKLELIRGLALRKTLVVAQFTLSTVLIITATVVYQQSKYAVNTDYGFRTENIVNMDLQGVDPGLIRDEIAGIAGVQQISAISDPFGFFSSGSSEIQREPADEPVNANFFSADRKVVPLLELDLLAGSNFPESVSANRESHIIVNESFVSALGWNVPAEAVGQSVWVGDSTQVQIAGVLRDFHYRTLSFPINPMILCYRPELFDHFHIELSPGVDTEEFYNKLKPIWEKAEPRLPLAAKTYREDMYDSHSYQRDIASLGFYALIALAIACLGLLGMVTYTVEVRTREVGIRKVLGAGTGSVISLLSREFVWLLILSAVLALPAGYWIGQQYLNTWTYHVSIGTGSLFAGLAVMGILGLLAIGWQTWQVARRNPVEAIRSE